MKKMTEENVKAALAGESQAHIKYLAFAEKAVAEKLPNVARAFKANAYAEQIHATNHLKTLGGIGTTKENLDAAVGGENFEVEEMYPAYVVVAQAQHKMTGTPVRTKWACRPVGYDNEHIYLKYLGYGPTRLRKLKETGVI